MVTCSVPERVKRRRGEPVKDTDSQSVSYFTVPPRAHPSTGSQSGSAAPVLTQVRVIAPGGHSIVEKDRLQAQASMQASKLVALVRAYFIFRVATN